MICFCLCDQVCEERSMYQAFLSAARNQSDNDQVSGSVTRVLMVGRSDSVTQLEENAFMKRLCCSMTTASATTHDMFDNNNERSDVGVLGSEPAMDIYKEWKHPCLPLYIHASRGLGGKGQLEQISNFLADRNSTSSFSSWFAMELGKDCKNRKSCQNLNDYVSSCSTRIHVVWLLYSVVSESTQSEWACLRAILQKNEIPVQIVLVTDKDKDRTGEHLWTNFLNKRSGFLLPNLPALSQHAAEHFITVPSDSLSNNNNEIGGKPEAEEEEEEEEEDSRQQQMIHDHHHSRDIQSHKETYRRRCLNELDHKALWASAEVIKTIANIQQTAQIIHAISLTLSKRAAMAITSTNFMTLYGRYNLERAAIFTLKFLCKMWEIPTKLETTMLRKLASWELNVKTEDHSNKPSDRTGFNLSLPRSSSNSITLRDHGRYLPFSIRLAHVIVYCKALHLKGWIDNMDDFSLELDNFHATYGKQFDQAFAKSSHFAIFSQIRQTILGSLGTSSSDRVSGFKQQLQNSLEKFLLCHVQYKSIHS